MFVVEAELRSVQSQVLSCETELDFELALCQPQAVHPGCIDYFPCSCMES
jgi:hypothetical protein